MDTQVRRYDVDWLRVIAIGLLLIYHIAITFQPWGIFIGFIQSNDPLPGLWIPMGMLNVWRIPLLFFVSGMGVSFAIRKRNWKQLLGERTRRILVPFLFGVTAIVPLHRLIWLRYYSQDPAYEIRADHLWFLANIFAYVLLLSPLFLWMKNHPHGKVNRMFRFLARSPLVFITVAGCFMAETLLVHPETFELYAMTLHGFVLGFLAFFFGFTCTLHGDVFWPVVKRWRWILLILSLLLFVLRTWVLSPSPPLPLTAAESSLWIFTALGFAAQYLNRPGRALSYLSQAAYPVYMLHMAFLYLGSSIVFPTNLSPVLKFSLVVLITFSGCFVTYELIRRIPPVRLLFGLKTPVGR